MPAKLPDTIRWTGRIDEADYELLRLLHPTNTNRAIRDILHAYCEFKRKGMTSRTAGGSGEVVPFQAPRR